MMSRNAIVKMVKQVRTINLGMPTKVWLVLLAVLAVFTISTSIASANGINIDWWVLSGGGSSLSSGDITLGGTLGQPFACVSTSPGVWLGAGFSYAEQPVQVYLPLIQH